MLRHIPAVHAGAEFDRVGHAAPQRPHCATDVCKSVSHPFAGSASQSPNIGLHELPQLPDAHDGVALLRTGQRVPHAPQFCGCVRMSVSHPLVESASQFA